MRLDVRVGDCCVSTRVLFAIGLDHCLEIEGSLGPGAGVTWKRREVRSPVRVKASGCGSDSIRQPGGAISFTVAFDARRARLRDLDRNLPRPFSALPTG